MPHTYLVTGAMGCIGAWTLYHLRSAGHSVISFDLSQRRDRLSLLLSEEEQADIHFLQGDLTDFAQVQQAIADHNVSHIIHLAALQVPFCRADPTMGARVNVVGTVNIFEAARLAGLKHLAYASSIAVYGPPQNYPPGLLKANAPFDPHTLYGVYKQANEGTARVYWEEHQLSSVTLRPYTVYGVGRDQGLTSEPTKAMLAVAANQPYHISFSGAMQFQLASDVARLFIASAQSSQRGAYGFNLGGPSHTVADVADFIREIKPSAKLTVADNPLPFPIGCDDSELKSFFPDFIETDLKAGIAQTITHFEKLLAEGKLTL